MMENELAATSAFYILSSKMVCFLANHIEHTFMIILWIPLFHITHSCQFSSIMHECPDVKNTASENKRNRTGAWHTLLDFHLLHSIRPVGTVLNAVCYTLMEVLLLSSEEHLVTPPPPIFYSQCLPYHPHFT